MTTLYLNPNRNDRWQNKSIGIELHTSTPCKMFCSSKSPLWVSPLWVMEFTDILLQLCFILRGMRQQRCMQLYLSMYFFWTYKNTHWSLNELYVCMIVDSLVLPVSWGLVWSSFLKLLFSSLTTVHFLHTLKASWSLLCKWTSEPELKVTNVQHASEVDKLIFFGWIDLV